MLSYIDKLGAAGLQARAAPDHHGQGEGEHRAEAGPARGDDDRLALRRLQQLLRSLDKAQAREGGGWRQQAGTGVGACTAGRGRG